MKALPPLFPPQNIPRATILTLGNKVACWSWGEDPEPGTFKQLRSTAQGFLDYVQCRIKGVYIAKRSHRRSTGVHTANYCKTTGVHGYGNRVSWQRGLHKCSRRSGLAPPKRSGRWEGMEPVLFPLFLLPCHRLAPNPPPPAHQTCGPALTCPSSSRQKSDWWSPPGTRSFPPPRGTGTGGGGAGFCGGARVKALVAAARDRYCFLLAQDNKETCCLVSSTGHIHSPTSVTCPVRMKQAAMGWWWVTVVPMVWAMLMMTASKSFSPNSWWPPPPPPPPPHYIYLLF